MNTQIDPADDIIELTEIIEEGAPAKDELDFAMDKAVDAGSLDRELDDLLREEGAAPQLEVDPIMDLDDIFEEPASAPEEPEPAPEVPRTSPSASDDLSDLDDLFDSLQMDDEDPSSLDLMLGEKSQGSDTQPSPAPRQAPAPDDTIDLDLDVPGLEASSSSPDLLELTDELLADIPDTMLVPPKNAAAKTPKAPDLHFHEGLDLDVGTAEESAPVHPAEAPAASEIALNVSQAELEILCARIDALEARPEPAPEVNPELILAALPQSPADLPLAAALRSEILDAVETRIAGLAPAEELEALKRSASEAAGRIDGLEARPEPTPEVSPELILAALPHSPADLPLAAALRSEILDAVETRIAGLAPVEELEALRRSAAEAAERIDALEARPEPAPEISPELILAALPQSPAELPLADALRTEILDAVETRVADLARAEELEALRQSAAEAAERLNALQGQLDALPEPPASAPEQDSALDVLDSRANDLEERLAAMGEAMAEKDALIMELREGQERMREELEALSAQLDAMPGKTSLKADLEEHVRQQVPAEVARIIREEIKALLKEMGA